MAFHSLDSGYPPLPPLDVSMGEKIAQIVYICPLAPFKKGRLRHPLYEVALRTGNKIERFQASEGMIGIWAEQAGQDVLTYVEKTLRSLKAPCLKVAGLSVRAGPLIMGIVNVTPDSFSDGGDHFATQGAIDHAKSLFAQGADILDIGGESTRPGAKAVSLEEELSRVIPVIQGLAGLGATLSIDTRHAEVMRCAINAGAHIINDVTALEGVGALKTAAELGVPVILMHMQGQPQTMQESPVYEDCVLDVFDYLKDRIFACTEVGIELENICVDPGIGFGKSLDHNMEILSKLGLYHGLGVPVLLGASRKSFIAKICPNAEAKDRLPGSLAAALQGACSGVQVLRVHDVAETKQALDVWAYL